MNFDISRLTTARARDIMVQIDKLASVCPTSKVTISRKDYRDFISQAEKKILSERKKQGVKDRKVDIDGLTFRSMTLLRHSE